MKFKVGDKVRITSNMSHHCFKIGDIVKITEIDENSYRGNNEFSGWFSSLECTPISPNNTHNSYDIHITSNGVYTNCLYKKNGEIVSSSSAKLNQDSSDVFDIKEGARLCIERLENKEKYNGKIICVETRFEYFTVGKIYEVKDGLFLDDICFEWNRNTKPFISLDDINDFFNADDRWKTKFIELVED